MPKFLHNIDMNGNQLINTKLEVTDSPLAEEGVIHYHDTNNAVRFYNGANWITLGTSDGDMESVTLTGGDGIGATNNNSSGGAYTSTISLDAALTTVTSIHATDLIIGEDSGTAVDFGTPDEIDFKANGLRMTLSASALYPTTNNQIDLGTSSLEFKNAYFDGTVTSDAFAGPLTGDVTGNADTATALANARTIGGVSFNGSANIDLPGVNATGNQATTGNAATATKIASITNSDIVQKTATQTLTNKTLTSPTLTTPALGTPSALVLTNATALPAAQVAQGTMASGMVLVAPALGTPASGNLANCTFPTANINTDVDVSVANLKTRLAGGFGSNAVTIGDSNDVVTIGNDLTVTGDLIVSGDTVTVNTATLSVEDPLVFLASGQSGTPSVDIGIVGERGSSANVGFIWDESADTWAAITTSDVGDTAGNVTITDYANIKATTFTGALAGNANTATALATTRAFQTNLASTSSANFDGSAANTHGVTGTLAVGNGGTGLTSLSTLLNSNVTTVSGNAGTASELATARDIGGVSFDGSADIDLPGVNSAGNQNTTGSAATLTTARTIGGVSFNGSANINLPGVNSAGNQNTSGSAATLTTARTIGGVSFNGSANINLPGVNTSGNQNTSGNAATATVLADGAVGGVKVFELAHSASGVAGNSGSNSSNSHTWTITHGMGAGRFYKVEVLLDSANYDTVFADVTRPSDTTIVITMADAVANGAYRAMVTRMA